MLIGISGLAGSGKDTLGKMISDMTTLPIVSLADPIKAFFVTVVGFNARYTEGDLKETENVFYIDYDMAVRRCLILYKVDALTATKAVDTLFHILKRDHEASQRHTVLKVYTSPRRLFQLWGTDVWRYLGGSEFWINQLPDKGICTDIRFDNEADAMDLNFRVQRQGHTSRAVAHVSENGISLEKCDAVVYNNSDLAALERKAGTIVRTYCDSDLSINTLYGELL